MSKGKNGYLINWYGEQIRVFDFGHRKIHCPINAQMDFSMFSLNWWLIVIIWPQADIVEYRSILDKNVWIYSAPQAIVPNEHIFCAVPFALHEQKKK